MVDVTGAVVGFVLMLVIMMLGLHVAAAMFIISALGALVYLGPAPLLNFGTQLWAVMNDFILTAIPLFVLLGELLMRSGVTQRMYVALSHWVSGMPGGLLHSNIGASALFASVSGSSVATAATIATVALPEFKRRRYSERLVLGSIAAGATLGILIPPSVNMIIYGALTHTSIGQLFMAGLLPGLVLTGLFMVAIIVMCLLNPAAGGVEASPLPMAERLKSLRDPITAARDLCGGYGQHLFRLGDTDRGGSGRRPGRIWIGRLLWRLVVPHAARGVSLDHAHDRLDPADHRGCIFS